jgi:hypothetical protein
VLALPNKLITGAYLKKAVTICPENKVSRVLNNLKVSKQRDKTLKFLSAE